MTDNIIKFEAKQKPEDPHNDELMMVMLVSKYFQAEFEILFKENFFKFVAVQVLQRLLNDGADMELVSVKVDAQDLVLAMADTYEEYIKDTIFTLSKIANEDNDLIH